MVRKRSFWTGIGFGLVFGSLLLQLLNIGAASERDAIDLEEMRHLAEREGYLLQPAHERWYTASELEAAIAEALNEQEEALRQEFAMMKQKENSEREGEGADRHQPEEIVIRSLLIPPGTTSERVADMLVQLGLIEDREPFLAAMTKRNQHRSIRSGIYEFRGDPDLDEIIEQITP